MLLKSLGVNQVRQWECLYSCYLISYLRLPEMIVLSQTILLITKKQVVVVVNKLDMTAPEPFSRERYDEIVSAVGAYLTKDCAFKPQTVRFVPVSAFHDHNVRASAEEEEKEGGGGDDDEGLVLTSWGITCYADIVGAEEAGAAASRGGGGGAGAARRGGAGEDVSRGSSSCCSLVDAIDSPRRCRGRAPAAHHRGGGAGHQESRGHRAALQGQVDVGQPLRLMPWGDRAVRRGSQTPPPARPSALGSREHWAAAADARRERQRGRQPHRRGRPLLLAGRASLSAATAATAAAQQQQQQQQQQQ